MNYPEAIEYLYNRLPVFHQIGAAAYKPGLENSIRLMEQLANPQQQYRIIHVAGTNGKGSVSHFLSAILQSAGYTTGLYTSPHLVDFGERIRVNGEKIRPEYVSDFVEKNEKMLDEIQPSFFEATMAMAFRYFADCAVDVAVIEVGLGGRLDSTNIVSPALSVITNISFDHTEFLGNTLAQIAAEKAGIIKPETPVVIGEVVPETRPVFIEKAQKHHSPLVFAEENIPVKFIEYSADKMIVETLDNEKLIVGLCGEYQLKNIATVLTAVEELQKLGFAIYREDVKNGLENVIPLTNLQG
ncbi:MAG TPA: Mur ligase family protein, partial [Paludibacteraceae bacterium]|nr:Mur ligase family protein [Paludibacteraceae bacterium]